MRQICSLAIASGVAFALSACAAGAGPGGLGALVGKRTLASAEPLFGFESLQCFRQPGFLLRLYGTKAQTAPDEASKPCDRLIYDLQTAAAAKPTFVDVQTVPSGGAGQQPAVLASGQVRRNEIMDALVAESNRKCTDYTTLLKSYDGSMNGSLSLLAILTGGLGSFVGGANTAKALAGTSSIISGSRSALNEVHFTNQTIHVLASAYEKTRRDRRREMGNRQMCRVDTYTLMAGIEDVMDYHNSCSLVAGLAEAAKAIGRSENPGVDTMRNTIAEMTSLRRQADQFVKEGKPIEATLSATDKAIIEQLERSEKAATDEFKAANDAVTKANSDLATETARVGSDAASRKPLEEAKAKAEQRLAQAGEALALSQGVLQDAQVQARVREINLKSAAVSAETRDLSQIRHCPFTPEQTVRGQVQAQ